MVEGVKEGVFARRNDRDARVGGGRWIGRVDEFVMTRSVLRGLDYLPSIQSTISANVLVINCQMVNLGAYNLIYPNFVA